MRRRSLSPDEKSLWKRFVETVTPLPLQTGISDPSEDEAPLPLKTPPKTKSSQNLTSEPTISINRQSLKNNTIHQPLIEVSDRRVRRGQVAINAKLDLHGMTQAQAHSALIRFISDCSLARKKSVLVITGKGDSEARAPFAERGRGILRARLTDWLATAEMKNMVWGYAQAHPRHGGDGAFYVFLKRAEN